MKLSCLVNCILPLLREGSRQGINLFADVKYCELLTCFLTIITKAAGFSLASMWKVVSLPSFRHFGHYWSEFGFRISQNENICSFWSKIFCFRSGIFLTVIRCLPPFFFLKWDGYSPASWLFQRFPTPCSLGMSSAAPPACLLLLCFMLAQLNVQLCGELIQLKNNLAEKKWCNCPRMWNLSLRFCQRRLMSCHVGFWMLSALWIQLQLEYVSMDFATVFLGKARIVPKLLCHYSWRKLMLCQ